MSSDLIVRRDLMLLSLQLNCCNTLYSVDFMHLGVRAGLGEVIAVLVLRHTYPGKAAPADCRGVGLDVSSLIPY